MHLIDRFFFYSGVAAFVFLELFGVADGEEALEDLVGGQLLDC